MKTLDYDLEGQNLVHKESGDKVPLTNGEFNQVSLMISFYYSTISKVLAEKDWISITNGYNRYLETFF